MNNIEGSIVSVDSMVGFWERVYCDANCFEWLLPNFLKPKNWDAMRSGDQYKNKLHRLVYKTARLMTTEKGQSRAWWIYKTGRTQEQWEVWWEEEEARPKNKYGF